MGSPPWAWTLSTVCCAMLHVCQSASLFSSWALGDITAGEERRGEGRGGEERPGASCLRLRDLSYISPYDDCCGVFGPLTAVQHSMCAAAVAAFARDYSDNLVFLLLAPQASQWKASNKIRALRTHQEPRWVAQAGRIPPPRHAQRMFHTHTCHVSSGPLARGVTHVILPICSIWALGEIRHTHVGVCKCGAVSEPEGVLSLCLLNIWSYHWSSECIALISDLSDIVSCVESQRVTLTSCYLSCSWPPITSFSIRGRMNFSHYVFDSALCDI